MFMFFVELDGRPVVTLKALPSDGMALRDAHREITPGYHMNKRHWITLHPGGTLTVGMVEELVTESYRLVVAGLPHDQQPVQPHAFGRRHRWPRCPRTAGAIMRPPAISGQAATHAASRRSDE